MSLLLQRASAISLPASLFGGLLLLLLLPARSALDMDVSIARHFIEGAERLAVKSDVFVVDSESSGPVVIGGVRGFC